MDYDYLFFASDCLLDTLSVGAKTTSTMTDSCNTTISDRKKFQTKHKVMAVGCGSHMCNNINKGIFALAENKDIQTKLERCQNNQEYSIWCICKRSNYKRSNYWWKKER